MQWTFNLPAEKSTYLTLVAFNSPSSSSICQGSDTKMFFSNPLTHFRWDLIYRLWVYLTLELRDIKSQIILGLWQFLPASGRATPLVKYDCEYQPSSLWLLFTENVKVCWPRYPGKNCGHIHSPPSAWNQWPMSAAGTFIAQSLKQTENQSRGCKPAPLTVCLRYTEPEFCTHGFNWLFWFHIMAAAYFCG